MERLAEALRQLGHAKEAGEAAVAALALARSLARAGRTRERVALIRHQLPLLSFLTVPMLRAEWDWNNLRGDPEFKALLADPKNSAPL